MSYDFPRREYLVPGLVPAEAYVVLAGAKSVGKTAWAWDLALALAIGGQAWGTVPVEQGDVLYWVRLFRSELGQAARA